MLNWNYFNLLSLCNDCNAKILWDSLELGSDFI